MFRGWFLRFCCGRWLFRPIWITPLPESNNMNMTHHLIFVFLAVLLLASPAFAADSYVIANAATETIDEHSTCKQVTNSTGSSIMVPTKAAGEWTSFRTNTPTNVSLADCPPPDFIDCSAADPHYANTVLCLQGEGANGSTTITDSSSGGKTVTSYNGFANTTAQAKEGGGSLTMTNGYARVADSADFSFPGDFTVEAWVRATSVSNPMNYFFTMASSTSAFNFTLGVMSTGAPYFAWLNAASLNTYPLIITLNTWHHIAVTREGTTIRLFLDGIPAATATQSGTLGYSTAIGVGGFHNTTSYGWNGQIDSLRVTKGVARYTAGGFTPE